jgi:molybdate transport system substrate-binding protein
MRKTILVAIAALVPMMMAAASAGAAELQLAGGGHFQGSGQPLVEAFTKATGTPAHYTPGNTGNGGMKKRMDGGEAMDVVVLNSDDMADQVKAGLIRPDSVVAFARDRMGFAVPKGAPKPDISTPEKLKAVLLSAKAIGMQKPDPQGHSGANIRQVLMGLGIFDEAVKKAVIITEPAPALVEGKADISFWAYPELLTRKDIEVVGPTPVSLGGFTDQSVGIPTSAKNVTEAQAFIRFLTSPAGQAVYKKTGLDPMPKGN